MPKAKFEGRIDPKLKRQLLAQLDRKIGSDKSDSAKYAYVLEGYARGLIREVEVMDELVGKIDAIHEESRRSGKMLDIVSKFVLDLRKSMGLDKDGGDKKGGK